MGKRLRRKRTKKKAVSENVKTMYEKYPNYSIIPPPELNRKSIFVNVNIFIFKLGKYVANYEIESFQK